MTPETYCGKKNRIKINHQNGHIFISPDANSISGPVIAQCCLFRNSPVIGFSAMKPSESKTVKKNKKRLPECTPACDQKETEFDSAIESADVAPVSTVDTDAEKFIESLPEDLSRNKKKRGIMDLDIPEELRKRVLRKLFQSRKYQTGDGLDDYNEDYRKFKALGNIVTSDMRNRIRRLSTGDIQENGGWNNLESDVNKCRGEGACEIACSTGAVKESQSRIVHMLEQIRKSFKKYPERSLVFRESPYGNKKAGSLIYSEKTDSVTVTVDNLGTIGAGILLASVAYGAGPIFLAAHDTDLKSLKILSEQLTLADEILTGMGFERNRFHLLSSGEYEDFLYTENEKHSKQPSEPGKNFQPAGFMFPENRRERILAAVDYLYPQSSFPLYEKKLKEGSPFGNLLMDAGACTVCKACVGACPTGALTDDKCSPRILFLERKCVQCGLCANVCPEKAIGLNPRMVYDRVSRNSPSILIECEPFTCVECGTPFATGKVVEKMTEKLSRNPMYQGKGALRRLRMCRDCRIRDIFENRGGNEPV